MNVFNRLGLAGALSVIFMTVTLNGGAPWLLFFAYLAGMTPAQAVWLTPVLFGCSIALLFIPAKGELK